MKLLKQVGTIAVASALLFTYAPQVWASETVTAVPISAKIAGGEDTAQVEAKITKEQALKLAETYIDIPEGYTLQSVNLNSYQVYRGHNTPNWNLSYAKKIKDQYYGNLNITINGLDGRLTGYNIYENDPEKKPSYPPKVDYKAAKEIAAKWIAKMNPDKQNELMYNDSDEQAFRTPLNGNYQYNIRYDRSVGGVPFAQNGVNVSVNGDGEVTSYNYNWDDEITFEQNAAPIGADKASQSFRDQVKLSLMYQIPYQAKGERKPILSYSMDTFMLNASSGEVWNPGGYPALVSGDDKPLTDKPLAEMPAANLNLTKEQAVDKVVSTFGLPAGMKLQDASYNEYTNPETGKTDSTWNLSWNEPTENDPMGKIGGFNAWATVNSKTGEITNFNRYVPYDQGKPNSADMKVSLDDAKAKATEFVKKNLPAYTDQLVLEEQSLKDIPEERLKEMRYWDIRFKRVIDGVNASYEGVNLSIDRVTGEIMNYNFSFSDIAYPKQKPEVISEDKAKELLLSQYDIKLMYVSMDTNMIPYGIAAEKYNLMVASGEIPAGAAADQAEQKVDAKLVYQLVPKYVREPFLLDAQTGQWKQSDTGEVISLERVKVDDIEGHWAQNELQLMLDYEALDVKDGKVNPDQAITRGEMIKMMVIAMNGGNNGIYYAADRAASFKDVPAASKYFAYVENAVDRGLLEPGEEFNPDATMTREQMAELIVKALGYKSLTKYDEVFNGDIADASKLKNIGEAAIVVGLDIMSLEDGKFNPDQEVTKAQAATGFFRYLQKRAELQDQPRYYY